MAHPAVTVRDPRTPRYLARYWPLYLMTLPGVALSIVFKYLPMAGIALAFKDYNIYSGFAASPWVGLGHFRAFLRDPYFYKVMSNTLMLSLLKLLFSFPVSIVLALMINELRGTRFKRGIQTVVYLPHFLSWSIVNGIFYTLLSVNGPVNDALAVWGLARIPFYISPGAFRGMLVFTDVWKSAGWGTIVYLAALTSIDPQLYDAARVDGASKLRQIRHITLPGIASTVVVMLILRLSSVLSAGFDQVYIMYNPTVYDTADIIETYVFRTGMGQQAFGYASAVGVFNSVVSMALILSCNSVSRRVAGQTLW